MALTQTPTDFSPSNIKNATPDKYTDLNEYLASVSMPDNRSALVESFGNEDLTGFLKMTGAINNVGTANEVTWWEKTRLMPTQNITHAATGATAATRVYPFASTATTTHNVRLNDVLILEDGSSRGFVSAITATGFTVAAFDGSLPAVSATGTSEIKIVGNTYAQGTDQPTEYFESNVNKLTNGFNIIKDIYKVTGSEATNISWVDLPDGDKRWFLQSQRDTNKRFKNYIETMLLVSEKIAASATGDVINNTGSEGYFTAIESRGIVAPKFTDVTSFDTWLDELDNQGGVSDEYAAYVSLSQELAIDNLLAMGGATGTINQGMLYEAYGQFMNGADAVKLGFKGFERGGRRIYKKRFKLLNESTMLKGTKFNGVIIPTGMSLDPVSGNYAPSLEMNYKSQAGENRLMKSWRTGSVLGATNGTVDAVQFNYLAEVNLVTRGAHQHTLIKY